MFTLTLPLHLEMNRSRKEKQCRVTVKVGQSPSTISKSEYLPEIRPEALARFFEERSLPPRREIEARTDP